MKKVNMAMKFSALISSFILIFMSTQVIAGEGKAHWSYEGEQGPEHWGELADEYLMCFAGANQSPIDLVADVQAELPELEFEYYSNNVDQINNGHTIQQNIKPGSFLRIPDRGTSFELKQFHFHSPSEHTVDGKHFAMEIHFVHASQSR
jgi:carbonic anhydrase